MGCDIHTMAEIKMKRQDTLYPNAIKKRYFEYEEYDVLPAVFDNPYHRVEDYVLNLDDFNAPFTNQPFRQRNYVLFSLLADVRNDGSIDPFDEPRGVPDDVSSAGYTFMHSYGVDGHSHTWYTLQELLDVDWDNVWKPEPGDNWKPFERITKDIARLKMICDRLEVPYTDARFIMFFDN